MQRNIRALFVSAIALSAFLLFTLELVAGRLVLPVFGGAPGVWATTLCFFTTVLFLAYGYAHLVATRLRPGRGGALHLTVAVFAIVGLVLAPAHVASLRNPVLPEALNVLLAQLVIAGPAAFLLASTTPLLSAWYGGRGRDPWWLYAASNGASFIAIIAYPFVIAPRIGLSAQRELLVAGVTLYALAIAAIAASNRRRDAIQPGTDASEPRPTPPNRDRHPIRAWRSNPPPHAHIPLRRQVIWLFAAFVPAGLLSATTNFITTDLISAPLLWIGPLAVYLLSFVVAFSTRGRALVRVAGLFAPAAAALLWIPWVANAIWPVTAIIAVELGAFLILAVAIHGRLAADRPDTPQLTRFYLVLSAGGMLATAFVALVAPSVFSAIYEYPILIVAALLALAVLPMKGAAPVSLRPVALVRDAAGRLIPFLIASALLLVVVSGGSISEAAPLFGFFVVAGYSILIAIWPVVLPISTALAILLLSLNAPSLAVYQTRTFFGVIRVDSTGGVHREYSGTTLHGAQVQGEGRREPTTYYVRGGPLDQVFEVVHAQPGNPTVAIVGLGVGTTEAYALPGDRFTYFEIDKAVVEIATNPRYFTYLSDAPIAPRIVLGDARLSLAAQPAGSYDLIILDAFSSDSVPVHLLTREALETYVRALRPGGLMLFHLSNRYYELPPAVISTARSVGLSALATVYVPGTEAVDSVDATISTWAVVGTAGGIEPFAALGWTDREPGPVLTDDFSDLLRTLRP